MQIYPFGGTRSSPIEASDLQSLVLFNPVMSGTLQLFPFVCPFFPFDFRCIFGRFLGSLVFILTNWFFGIEKLRSMLLLSSGRSWNASCSSGASTSSNFLTCLCRTEGLGYRRRRIWDIR